LISFSFSQTYDVLLSIENLDEGAGTFDIRMINSEIVGGLQIGFESGISITSVSGGSAAAAGFMSSPAGSYILSFTFTGATIPIGNEILMNVSYTGSSPVFDFLPPGAVGCGQCTIISDTNANSLPTEEYVVGLNGTWCAESDFDLCGNCYFESSHFLYDVSYTYVPNLCVGCTDNSACNYDADATVDSGGCVDPVDDCTNCDGSDAGGQDCLGICGGPATEDGCGVCDADLSNDNETCTDCNGDVNGTAFIDGCGICVGGTTGEDECTEDCAGVEGGTAFFDECGACVPAGDLTCTQGCDGNWSNDGSALLSDECGVCGGDNSTCSDCNGDPNGTATPDLNCFTSVPGDICVGGNTSLSPCEEDCAGTWGGTSVIDDCGICNGNNADKDCSGVCGGSAEEDCAGECDGDAKPDECGVCDGTGKDGCSQCPGDDGLYGYTGLQNDLGGYNSTCAGCMDATATNYNSTVGDPIQQSNLCSGDGCTYDCDGTLGGPNTDCCYYAFNTSSIDVVWEVTIIGDTTTWLITVDEDAAGVITQDSLEIAAVYIAVEDLTDLSEFDFMYRSIWFSDLDSVYQTASTEESHFFTDVSYGDTTNVKLQIINSVGQVLEKSETFELRPLPLSSTNSIPRKIWLSNNYPNPFNPMTSISYSVERAGEVNISIYNLLGYKVYDLVSGYHIPGIEYSVTWDSNTQSNMPISTGIYFYEMQLGDYIETKKMVLVK
jgi:hypothetical protein